MKRPLVLVALCLCLSLTPSAWSADAPHAMSKVSQTQIDPRGMTLEWGADYGVAINGQAFQFEAITSFKGYQYAVYWVRDEAAKKAAPSYYLAVARRKLGDAGAKWSVINLPDSPFKQGRNRKGEPTDAHNTASIGICPADGTIHLSFDMHGQAFRYRVSKVGAASDPDKTEWTKDVFDPESQTLGDLVLKVITYPMFVRTPEGNLQMFVRTGGSGIGSNWVYDYDGSAHRWKGGRQFDEGLKTTYSWTDLEGKTRTTKTRNAYPNAYQYGPSGKLYATWVFREGPPNDGGNHDICFAYSDDQGVTWKNNAGTAISNTNGDQGLPKQMDVNSPGISVLPVGMYHALMNTQGQAIDHADQVHIFMWYLDEGNTPTHQWDAASSSYHHSFRDAEGKWHTTTLPQSIGGGAPGSRPRLLMDKDDNVIAVYTVRTGRDVGSNKLYLKDGKLMIVAATKASGWADWKVLASEDGPFVNEPLVDYQRFAEDGVLSVMMQASPRSSLEATPIRVFDFARSASAGAASANSADSGK